MPPLNDNTLTQMLDELENTVRKYVGEASEVTFHVVPHTVTQQPHLLIHIEHVAELDIQFHSPAHTE